MAVGLTGVRAADMSGRMAVTGGRSGIASSGLDTSFTTRAHSRRDSTYIRLELDMARQATDYVDVDIAVAYQEWSAKMLGVYMVEFSRLWSSELLRLHRARYAGRVVAQARKALRVLRKYGSVWDGSFGPAVCEATVFGYAAALHRRYLQVKRDCGGRFRREKPKRACQVCARRDWRFVACLPVYMTEMVTLFLCAGCGCPHSAVEPSHHDLCAFWYNHVWQYLGSIDLRSILDLDSVAASEANRKRIGVMSETVEMDRGSARVLAGLSRHTVLRLRHGGDELAVTHAGPGANGKYSGWIIDGESRPVVSSKFDFLSAADAERHMRTVMSAASERRAPKA